MVPSVPETKSELGDHDARPDGYKLTEDTERISWLTRCLPSERI